MVCPLDRFLIRRTLHISLEIMLKNTYKVLVELLFLKKYPQNHNWGKKSNLLSTGLSFFKKHLFGAKASKIQGETTFLVLICFFKITLKIFFQLPFSKLFQNSWLKPSLTLHFSQKFIHLQMRELFPERSSSKKGVENYAKDNPKNRSIKALI